MNNVGWKDEFFDPSPNGEALVFDGWRRAPNSQAVYPHWHQVSGPRDSHQIKEFGKIKTDPRLKHILETVLTPGTTLGITDASMSEATRSQAGFRIMSGSVPRSE